MKRSCLGFRYWSVICIAIHMSMAEPVHGQSVEEWRIVVSESSQQDEAIKVALSDLKETGAKHGLSFEVINDEEEAPGNCILVGDTQRNPAVSRFVSEQGLTLPPIEHEQGYEILTREVDGAQKTLVCGGSVIGDVYGLYWIWDRIRVHHRLPAVNVRRAPALEMRVGAAWGRHGIGGSSEERMKSALRYSMNWVAGPAVLDLVPWDSEPERTTNAGYRARTRELIAYAHSLHLKYFSFANEFTYHPSLLDEFDASLSPCDPKFWEAVQAKFRRLFQALPELDGIELCNDDISGFWENYRAFDLMHEGEGCEWPYDKRFRTFVQKVRDVVVGEFQKTYFHFTWSLVNYEQHSQPDVYRKIFTDEIPAKNLYLVPKITAGDRWWHQPYNPTFNLTPHNTIVCFETMNYYEGGRSNIFPTFSGQYFQAGLQTILRPSESNVKGAAMLAGVHGENWGTTDAYVYSLYRLAWDPDERIEQIARDFCAIHFGQAAADAMADIYLLSPVAYKYGLHIEPVSYGQFNSFIHMRVGTFPAEGYPRIDGGREHLEFLQKIYLRCKPWKTETLDDLDHGLAVAGDMANRFETAKDLLGNEDLAREVEDRLNMTRLLIETNNLYVRTAFAFFEYIEDPSEEKKQALAEVLHRLSKTRDDFMSAPGFNYKLFGIDVLLENAQLGLADIEATRERLKNAPTRVEVESTIEKQQARYKEVLDRYGKEAIHFAQVEVLIDGRDILRLKGDQYEVEHLRWDSPHVRECKFLVPLPKEPVTVVPRDIQSRPMHPFILEQPDRDNDYTTSVYLYDKPGGPEWVVFDLYYIPTRPGELDLAIPWRE